MPRSQNGARLPRVWSRRTRLAAGAAAVVVALAVGAAVVFLTRPGPPRVLPDAAGAFGPDEALAGGVRWAAFSPSGRLVLVRTSEGIGIATGDEDDGEVAFVTPPGSRAVDAAWFPAESAVLVAEGPVSTGQLAVVEVDGTVRGAIPLEPSFGVGDGHGMSVAPDGRHAVVTAERREPIGGARHLHLVLVDLEDGTVRELTAPDGRDELRPAFITDDRVAFTERDASRERSRVMELDIETRAATPVSPPGEVARLAGIVDGRVAYVIDGALVVDDADGPRRFTTFRGRLLAVHPAGQLLIVDRGGVAHMIGR